jgi:cytochrome P450
MPNEVNNIVSVGHVGMHAAMRKDLSHGFSATALLDQEDLIQHFVNLLIDQIGQHGMTAPIDMVKWYNLTTFDIIGELSFGEPFGGLQAGAIFATFSMPQTAS